MKQVEGFGKVSMETAIDEFLRSCRLRNLSPKTIRYYEEDLEYFSRNISVKYVSEICRETVDNFIIQNAQLAVDGVRIVKRLCTIPAIFYKHYPALIAGTMNVSELARVCGLSSKIKNLSGI